MAPSVSRSSNQTRSSACSPEPFQLARASARWRSIAGVEGRRVDRHAAGAQGVLGEIEREAVGVVELERGLAGQLGAGGEAGGRLVEQAEAALEGLAKARLLELQDLGDQRLGAHQLGERQAHLGDQHRDEAPHQRLGRAQHVGVAHRAAHDPAQHVAAALVGRHHAVGDQEGRGAQVVGDDLVRGRAPRRRARVPVSSSLAWMMRRNRSMS